MLQLDNDMGKCAWCAGTGHGVTSGGNVISCLVCGGKGKLKVTQPPELCGICNGSGRRSELKACFTCVGTGWSRVFVKAKAKVRAAD